MNEYNKEFWKALDELVSKSEVIIDRPKGTVHPKFPDFVYKVDYGYLKDTSSMDGAGIDVWLGSCGKQIDAVMCIVDLLKIYIRCRLIEAFFKITSSRQYLSDIIVYFCLRHHDICNHLFVG